MKKCSQCDRPAIGSYGEHPLCLNCLERFSAILQQQSDERHRQMMYNMQLANMAEADMNAMFGVGPSRPTFDLSVFQPPRHVKVNNINVSNSVIGAVSTEEVGNIQVSLRNAVARGEGTIAGELLQFTREVLTSTEINDGTKNELLEQISLLAEQVAIPKESRKPGIIKAALSAISGTVGTVGAIAETWNAVKDLLS